MVLKLDLDGIVHHVTILARRPHLVLSVDGRRHVVQGLDEAGDGLSLIHISEPTRPY